MSKINEAFDAALARVQLTEWRIMALEFAIMPMRNFGGTFSEITIKDIAPIRAELYARLSEAQKNLLVWSAMTDDKERKDVARKMAYKRFLREGSEIMQYLNISGEPPGSYSAEKWEEFRAELDELARKIGIDDG